MQYIFRSSPRILLFSLLGILVVLLAEIVIPFRLHFFLGFLLFLIALFGRIARRNIYFNGAICPHACFAFETMFQSFFFLSPHMAQADVETQCIHRELPQVQNAALSGWQDMRTSSSIIISFFLIFAITAFHSWILAGLIAFLTLLLILRTQSPLGTLLGLVSITGEALLFCVLSRYVLTIEQSIILYTATLAICEFSPIPLALGSLEIGTYLTLIFLQAPIEALIAPLWYRMFRFGPLILMTLFYLPRYKMTLADIYNPKLAKLLSLRFSHDANETFPITMSIVIPTYNEEKRLPEYLPQVIKFCSSFDTVEIIVSDDGSSDATCSYVKSLQPSCPFLKLLAEPINHGKGYVVKKGVLAASGKYILFTDADGATPISEVTKLLGRLDKNFDIAIGIRTGSRQELEKSYLRDLTSKIFSALTNILALPGLQDTQCGFKLFGHRAAKKIFSQCHEQGFAFDVELLYLAQKAGMRIAQVPVAWHAIEGSKVHPIRDGIRMFRAIFRARKRLAGFS